MTADYWKGNLRLIFVRRSAFNTLETIKQLLLHGPAGNRWFKVNLHVHAVGHDASKLIELARQAQIDLLAVTDHQTFSAYSAVAEATKAAGRPIVVLPGIEITAHEGVHLLAIFPISYAPAQMQSFLGWLEIDGQGDTNKASKRHILDILRKVDQEQGVCIVPHPHTAGIGFLDSARKISTKTEWLESGLVQLMQVAESKVKYIDRDEAGNWVNRYVLASAKPEHIHGSRYCLAPFNATDVHEIEQIGVDCSWFRMASPTVDGLKQVACEPRTRISRTEPPPCSHPAILGMHVSGGYCDSQSVQFNVGMNCVIGQNYAGKSAVFDLIRFALEQDLSVPADSKSRLLERLSGILGDGGVVELLLQQGGAVYVLRRKFVPQIINNGPTAKVAACDERSVAYRYDPSNEDLVPEENFSFPVEVYEQGRIHRLRDDVSRQLDMLDEFAGLMELKSQRADVVGALEAIAQELAPLCDEREQLLAQVAGLDQNQKDLAELEKLIPGAEEAQWATAARVIEGIETLVKDIGLAASAIPQPSTTSRPAPRNELERLFVRKVPEYPADPVAESDTVSGWYESLGAALRRIEDARAAIMDAAGALAADSHKFRATWKAAYTAHQQQIARELKSVGIESPQAFTGRVAQLRSSVHDVITNKQPRLKSVNDQIAKLQGEREEYLDLLGKVDGQVSEQRQAKARNLRETLAGQIQVIVQPAADRQRYLEVLNELCDQIKSKERKIQNRDEQLEAVASSVDPITLGRALCNGGKIVRADGSITTLVEECSITENTQNVLCLLAQDIHRLTCLQTTPVPDKLQILVRRRGESSLAELSSGLSPGEQSAAILTLALQTRGMPLIVDQPEDELGYSYVVHLIVPKMLQAKATRQLLIITHNANIPVLGDADHVVQMENRPRPSGGRSCVVAQAGCFESSSITNALIALEGGKQAFQFRQHRYSLPRAQRLTLPYGGEVS